MFPLAAASDGARTVAWACPFQFEKLPAHPACACTSIWPTTGCCTNGAVPAIWLTASNEALEIASAIRETVFPLRLSIAKLPASEPPAAFASTVLTRRFPFAST